MKDLKPGTNVRCNCGKLICQLDGEKVIIKCRHCKRFVVIDLRLLKGQRVAVVSFPMEDVALCANTC